MKRTPLLGLALAIVALAAAPPREQVLLPRGVLRYSSSPTDLAFSPDGRLLAACAIGEGSTREKPIGEITVWDVSTGKHRATWRLDEAEPSALAFSPDGKKLYCIAHQELWVRWDVSTGKKEGPFRPKEPREQDHPTYSGILISSDGKQVASTSAQSVTVWNATTAEEVVHRRWKTRGEGVLSHDLRLVAVTNTQDVDLRDVRTGKLVRSLMDHPGSISQTAFSRDDRFLAVAYDWTRGYEHGKAVCLWDARRGVLLRTIEPKGMIRARIELSPAGNLLIVVGDTGERGTYEVRLYETATGGELARLQPVPDGEWVGCVRFSPDGRLLAIEGSDRTVRLYEIRLPRKTR